jgi:hypothetical protein
MPLKSKWAMKFEYYDQRDNYPYEYEVNKLKKCDEMMGVRGMDKWYARYKKKEEYWLKHGKHMRGKDHKVFKPYPVHEYPADLRQKTQPRKTASQKNAERKA